MNYNANYLKKNLCQIKLGYLPPVTSHMGVIADSSTGTPTTCSGSGAVIPGKRRTKANSL